MIETHKYIGKTEEEVLNLALYELNTKKENIIYEEQEVKGGLFQGKKIQLEIIKKEDVVDFVKKLITDITTKMGLDTKIEIMQKEDNYNVILHSDNNNVLIGKMGKNVVSIMEVVMLEELKLHKKY